MNSANAVFVGSSITFQEGREVPADTTVSDTEIKNNMNDQENKKSDADNV